MVWPIKLTAKKSAAILDVARRYLERNRNMPVGQIFSIVLSQMQRGVVLGQEEQELLRAALVSESAHIERYPDFEDGFFALYGFWVIEPPHWEEELKQRYPDWERG